VNSYFLNLLIPFPKYTKSTAINQYVYNILDKMKCIGDKTLNSFEKELRVNSLFE